DPDPTALPWLARLRSGIDARHLDLGLGAGADRRHHGRCHRIIPPSCSTGDGCNLCRAVSQYSPATSTLPVVLRRPRIAAGRMGILVEAGSAFSGILDIDPGPRTVHLRP